jgi:hypothetical protein
MGAAAISGRSTEPKKDHHRQYKSQKDDSSSDDSSSSLDYEELVKKRRASGVQHVIETVQAQTKHKGESSKSSSEGSKRVAKDEVIEKKAETPKAKPVEPVKKRDEDEDWVLSEPPAKPVPEVAIKESQKAASDISKE